MNPEALKKLVSANLQIAIDADAEGRPDGAKLTHEEIARKAGVGKGSVGRIKRAEVGTGIDTLEAVAAVFGLRAWQMLVGPLDMQKKPELLTQKVRQELEELRALRALVEGWNRGDRQGEPARDEPGTTGNREDSGG